MFAFSQCRIKLLRPWSIRSVKQGSVTSDRLDIGPIRISRIQDTTFLRFQWLHHFRLLIIGYFIEILINPLVSLINIAQDSNWTDGRWSVSTSGRLRRHARQRTHSWAVEKCYRNPENSIIFKWSKVSPDWLFIETRLVNIAFQSWGNWWCTFTFAIWVFEWYWGREFRWIQFLIDAASTHIRIKTFCFSLKREKSWFLLGFQRFRSCFSKFRSRYSNMRLFLNVSFTFFSVSFISFKVQ